jgi:hypothetical protein
VRDRRRKLRRFAERRYAEHSSRAAVQHHPVVNAVGGEELLPALRLMPTSHTESRARAVDERRPCTGANCGVNLGRKDEGLIAGALLPGAP